MTYEPAALPDGTLAGARPGSGNFSFVVRGKSAHAGRNPEEGRNAVLAAAELALALYQFNEPSLKVNPSRIDGGSPTNVVPDLAIIRVNFRPADADWQLEAGMVFHMYILARGMGFSETMLVTADGAERLTRVERELAIR